MNETASACSQLTWLDSINAHEGLAAWLQTFIIFFAAWISYRTWRRDRQNDIEDRKSRARAMAEFLFWPLFILEYKARFSKIKIENALGEFTELQQLQADIEKITMAIPEALLNLGIDAEWLDPEMLRRINDATGQASVAIEALSISRTYTNYGLLKSLLEDCITTLDGCVDVATNILKDLKPARVSRPLRFIFPGENAQPSAA